MDLESAINVYTYKSNKHCAELYLGTAPWISTYIIMT